MSRARARGSDGAGQIDSGVRLKAGLQADADHLDVEVGREASRRILGAVQSLSRAYQTMSASPPSPAEAQAYLAQAIATLTAVPPAVQADVGPLCNAIRELSLNAEPRDLRAKLLQINGALLDLSRAVARGRAAEG